LAEYRHAFAQGLPAVGPGKAAVQVRDLRGGFIRRGASLTQARRRDWSPEAPVCTPELRVRNLHILNFTANRREPAPAVLTEVNTMAQFPTNTDTKERVR
jgi:hypothetical protein